MILVTGKFLEGYVVQQVAIQKYGEYGLVFTPEVCTVLAENILWYYNSTLCSMWPYRIMILAYIQSVREYLVQQVAMTSWPLVSM